MFRTAVCVAVVALLCLGTSLARPSRGGRRGGGRARAKACEVDYGNGTVVTRTCGCDGETGVTCSLTSTRADNNRDGITYKFCYQEQDLADPDREWTGPLKKACRVTLADGTEYTRTCRCNGTCGTEAVLSFPVGGQDAQAFFCERPEGDDRDDNEQEDPEDPEGPVDPEGPEGEGPAPLVDDSCVCLREVRLPSRRHMRACKRTVNSEDVFERPCGCAGEEGTPASCDVTKTETDDDGQVVETKFCYQPPTEDNGQFTFTGVLAGACLIESTDGVDEYQTGPCPCGSVCSSDVATALTGFMVNGKDARAFFCSKPGRDDVDDDSSRSGRSRSGRSRSGRRRGDRSGSDSDDPEDEECVCLMTEGADCTVEIEAERADREAERDECPAGRRGGQDNGRGGQRGDQDRRRGGRRQGPDGDDAPAGNQGDNRPAGNQGNNRPTGNRGNTRPAGQGPSRSRGGGRGRRD